MDGVALTVESATDSGRGFTANSGPLADIGGGRKRTSKSMSTDFSRSAPTGGAGFSLDHRAQSRKGISISSVSRALGRWGALKHRAQRSGWARCTNGTFPKYDPRYCVQLTFTPASPSANAPNDDDFADANTHEAEVPKSFGPAIPAWLV